MAGRTLAKLEFSLALPTNFVATYAIGGAGLERRSLA
jgi:hypothetical protein